MSRKDREAVLGVTEVPGQDCLPFVSVILLAC